MTAHHLDDEDLSAHLDGDAAPPHLGSCAVCSDRLGALGAARDTVAAAGVDPLPRSAIDEMVARAMEAQPIGSLGSEDPEGAVPQPVAPSADLVARRGRRTPPPTWLITAAAAIAALAGIAGLLRATGSDSSSTSLADGGGNGGLQSLESSGRDENGSSDRVSGAPKVAGAAVDPEVVQMDLGDQDDPVALTALVSDDRNSSAAAQTQTASPTRSESSDTASDEESPAPPSPTTTALRVDRARCRTEAERIGAGRFSRLVSTSTLRWKATPAEVLVFALTEPSGGISRQAMVLARSNCALLADPRF